MITSDLKKLILLPNIYIPSKSPIDATHYFQSLRKDIVMQYVEQQLLKSEAKSSWEVLKHLLKESIFSETELNHLADLILNQIDASQNTEEKIYYLKASEKVLTGKS